MHPPVPYLNFEGTCEEAFTFYTKLFNGTIDYLGRFKDMPPDMQVPPGYGDKVMHVSLSVDGRPLLMGSDAPDGFGPPYVAGSNVHLSLSPVSEGQAQQWFDALKEGGRVNMELVETFWAKRFGMVVDRFGISWMISYGEPGK